MLFERCRGTDAYADFGAIRAFLMTGRGAGPCQGQDPDRSALDLRARRSFPAPDPPAASFYSSNCGGAHPEQHLVGYAGLMQADACAGFSRLYEANRKGGPIIEAACWAQGRRKFFSRGSARRRSQPWRSSASMFFSPASVRSTVLPRRSV